MVSGFYYPSHPTLTGSRYASTHPTLTGSPPGTLREAGLRPSTGVRNRDGKRSQCGGRVSRHKAPGVQDCDPPHRYRVYTPLTALTPLTLPITPSPHTSTSTP
ncbi:hypothetical protein [Fischerella major]|uniref:hypothetical protein n=1 Tax=Fischerella major TaxID=210993 RepID=UPI000B117094|nr:hypothetical protein [Fischerella major]